MIHQICNKSAATIYRNGRNIMAPIMVASACPSSSSSSSLIATTGNLRNLRSFSTASIPTPPIALTSSIESIIQDSNRMITASTDADLFNTYTTDWTGRFKGESVMAVVFPKTTSEVSNILKYCYENDIAVVPQGGNTGLVGGGVGLVGAKRREIIISLEKMNDIINVDNDNFTVTCEAGCVLQTLSTHLEDQYDLIVPLDLGAKGSCQIGGNIATNAGGLRVVKYGNISKHVLGMEVVLADGTVLDMLKTLRKDNTGYNLNNMFMGSEGTLGIITKVALSVCRKPFDVRVSFIAVESMDHAIKLLGISRKKLGEHLSSFELIDKASLKAVIEGDESQANVHKQFDKDHIHVMIETSDLNDDKLLQFMEECFEKEIIVDSIMSQNESHSSSLWRIREMIPVCLMDMSRESINDRKGRLIKYDVSVDVNEWDNFLNSCREDLRSKGFLIDQDNDDNDETKSSSLPSLIFHNFGHMGDANMHLNILLTSKQVVKHNIENVDDIHEMVDEVVYNNVGKFHGSISAEHCIGQLKSKYLPFVKSKAEYNVMRNLKQVMDPKNILNPGKMLMG